jgi:hypothetical protein
MSDTMTMDPGMGQGTTTSTQPGTVEPAPPAQVSTGSSSPSYFSEGTKFATDFADHLGPEFDSYRATASKFAGKDLTDLIRSYGEAQKLIGQRQDGMVKVPGAEAPPEEIAAFHRAIGVPESPDKYSIDRVKMPQGIELKAERLDGFKRFAAERGIPQSSFEAVLEYEAQYQAQAAQEAKVAMEDYLRQQEETLREEWGPKYDQRAMRAMRAAETLGLPQDHPALQDADVRRAMARFADMISEDKLAGNESVVQTMSFGSQARDIVFNPDNPLHKSYHDSTDSRHREAVARYNRLLSESSRRGEL